MTSSDIVSWLGVLLLILGMYLTAKKNILAWPVNIIGCAIMVGYFWILHKWAFVFFNILSIIVAIHGWVKWNKD